MCAVVYVCMYVCMYVCCSDPYGGWSADEWLKLTAIITQYSGETCNRRMLYIDRLLREFPHKSRAEIVSWLFQEMVVEIYIF